jgi:hypothetical protein
MKRPSVGEYIAGDTSRQPAIAKLASSALGSSIRRNGHTARRKIRSIRASVTVTMSVRRGNKPNSIVPAKSS